MGLFLEVLGCIAGVFFVTLVVRVLWEVSIAERLMGKGMNRLQIMKWQIIYMVIYSVIAYELAKWLFSEEAFAVTVGFLCYMLVDLTSNYMRKKKKERKFRTAI
jgi:hypothetical protein